MCLDMKYTVTRLKVAVLTFYPQRTVAQQQCHIICMIMQSPIIFSDNHSTFNRLHEAVMSTVYTLVKELRMHLNVMVADGLLPVLDLGPQII